MVVPERNIAKPVSVNLDIVMKPYNNNESTIEWPDDTTVNIQQGCPTLWASVGGPCSNSSSPLNSSPSSEMDYTEHISAQNNMDVEINSASLTQTHSGCNSSFNFLLLVSQPLGASYIDNVVNTSNPLPQGSDINYSVSPPALEPLFIPYQTNQPVDPQLWDSITNGHLLDLW